MLDNQYAERWRHQARYTHEFLDAKEDEFDLDFDCVICVDHGPRVGVIAFEEVHDQLLLGCQSTSTVTSSYEIRHDEIMKSA